MREIKVRVWDNNRKKYVLPGHITLHGNGNKGLWTVYDDLNEIVAFNGDNAGSEFILEQFTGLKDKNGQEIYEGDIVKGGYFAVNDVQRFGDKPYNNLPHGQDENEITTEHWRKAVIWEIAFLYELEGYMTDNPDVVGIEVVGNVHDTPELLEEPA